MMRRLCPRRLGSFVQSNAQLLLLLLSLALLVLCAAINSAKLDTDLASWIHRTPRVDHELQAVTSAIGGGADAGTNGLLLLQAARQPAQDDVLSVESLMIHLEALAIATHVTVDLFDVTWSLKDLCYSPTLPDFEELLPNLISDRLMPCAIKTPLDCFWEGSKLMGPEQDVLVDSMTKLKWTNLNPLLMVEALRREHPHGSFPYETLIALIKRTGINSGYTERPCLDPSDPNCPASAPNKASGAAPNVAAELTNGCHGLASRQMHWREEEIVGGILHNRSGYIVRASALQSTIQLMGERDVYDYQRKTLKVQDINNWSIDKAKMVLEQWQRRFLDELAQFTRTSVASSSYKIHALTPKSMLEPIDTSAILDLTDFKLTVILLTLATCFMFPSFTFKNNSVDEDKTQILLSNKLASKEAKSAGLSKSERHEECQIGRVKLILLAILTSLIVILTFVASLGLSSFMNLPFNMITTQILPPIALYYGFRQALMIANTYSKHYSRVTLDQLTTESLNELLPVIILESIILIVPLVVASVFPVHAMRVFALQAVTYIILSTVTSILLVPALLITFLMQSSLNRLFQLSDSSKDKSVIYIRYKSSNNMSSQSNEAKILSIKAKKSVSGDSKTRPESSDEPTIEELILSRLQEDLRNIRADTRQQPTDINFSAQFRMTKSRSQQSNSSNCPIQPTNQKPTQQTRPELPDLLQWSDNKMVCSDAEADDDSASACDDPESDDERPNADHEKSLGPADDSKLHGESRSLIYRYSDLLTSSKYVQALACLFSLVMLVVIMPQSASLKYGMQLRDIVIRGSVDYESLVVREKYFPVYNVFFVTRDKFDYANNQRLLYELHRRVEQVEGVVRPTNQKRGITSGEGSKFWLTYFREWLQELQDVYDAERNSTAKYIDRSNAYQLAYRLLVQTGRADNPIDETQVNTNRLVDKNGIINQKAFYYYLTAWVINDAFTYSNSEANFRPEPKVWRDSPSLVIERARPPSYAQMPFLLKLAEEGDGLRTIMELRTISQAFEQLGLPNFPNGVPFIFWDQFINLDLLFTGTFALVTLIYILVATLITSNVNLALILIVPGLVTVAELYSFLGLFSFQFNTIVAVILLSSTATATIQTSQCIMNFQSISGSLTARINQIFGQEFRMMVTSLTLLLISACIFRNSKIDFMIKYSYAIVCLVAMNFFNSLVLTPVLLVIFAPSEAAFRHQHHSDQPPNAVSRHSPNGGRDISRVIQSHSDKLTSSGKKRIKTRGFPRVQSEISLSTIAEEPQSDARN